VLDAGSGSDGDEKPFLSQIEARGCVHSIYAEALIEAADLL